MTIRVAQLMGQMNGGGVEAVVMNYYRHIDKKRVQFDLIVDEDSEMIPREEVESMGGRVFLVPPLKSLKSHETALARLCNKERWRIVHSHRNALSVFPLRVAKRAGVPVRIAHSHSTSGKGEHAKNAVKGVLRRFSNAYPTHRLACSRFAGEWLFGKDSNFEVLHNAIELDRFVFSKDTRKQIRSELCIGDQTFVVGHVGRFMPQKNQMFLLEAFENLIRIREDATLLLVGEGKQKPLAEGWVFEHGLSERVAFLDQRDDVDRLYQAFDAFALPSLYEGLGIVGVEAQRAGLPCFLSDTITREVDVTKTVRFLPIENPQIWADALVDMQPGERLAANPEDFDDYDIARAAVWLAEYYERALADAGVR